MTMAMDVYNDDDNTASCKAAARREAEAGPSMHNKQTMRGKNGQKRYGDNAAFDDDDNNVNNGDG